MKSITNNDSFQGASHNEIDTKGWDAIMQLGQEAKEAQMDNMSIEEINAIIKEIREKK